MSISFDNPIIHAAPTPEWLSLVQEKVKDMRFGVVQIVVHEAKVTQIERTEKTRLIGIGES